MKPQEYKEIRYRLQTSNNTYLLSTLTECRNLEKVMQRLDLEYAVSTLKYKPKEVFTEDQIAAFDLIKRGDLQRVNKREETQRIRAKETRKRAARA